MSLASWHPSLFEVGCCGSGSLIDFVSIPDLALPFLGNACHYLLLSSFYAKRPSGSQTGNRRHPGGSCPPVSPGEDASQRWNKMIAADRHHSDALPLCGALLLRSRTCNWCSIRTPQETPPSALLRSISHQLPCRGVADDAAATTSDANQGKRARASRRFIVLSRRWRGSWRASLRDDAQCYCHTRGPRLPPSAWPSC